MVNANKIQEDLRYHPGVMTNSGEEELSAQISMLPSPGEVSSVVCQLDMDDLREFAAAIMNAAVDSVHKGQADLDTVRLLNSWFASMEETIAAGDDIEEILSRRRYSRDSAQ